MEKDWYRTENTETGYSSEIESTDAEPGEKKKKRSFVWILWTLAALCVLALIVVTSLLFASRSPAYPPQLPRPDYDYDAQADEWAERYDSFQEFFENYYSSSTAEYKAVCNIPRVDSLPGGELELRPKSEELTKQEIYKNVFPSVVGIRSYLKENDEDDYYWGTGIIASEDGLIITNAHLVSSESKAPCRATVILHDDSEYSAQLIGFDSRSDIALLKIDAHDLVAAEFCDSSTAEVGDSVLAIGNPLQESFRGSMTEGIISGIDRDLTVDGVTMTLLQISAPINEGNSGGPLLNMSGQVIGITNMKMSSSYYGAVTIEGVGFAIPSGTVKTVGDSLLNHGEMVGRPALGITVGSIPDSAKKAYDLPAGLYISSVSAGSDCEAQGILPGDVLIAMDGESVTKSSQVLSRIQKMEVGDTLTLSIWRLENGAGRSFDVTVQLMEMNDIYK